MTECDPKRTWLGSPQARELFLDCRVESPRVAARTM